MSQITITIKTDNAAFWDEDENEPCTEEAARIVRVIAGRIEAGGTQGTARDINGNTVALFYWEQRDRCAKCEDVPGRDGRGRPCKGCNGTGYVPKGA